MAGAFNRYLSKTLKMLETTGGGRARGWASRAEVLREAAEKGTTPLRASRMAHVEAGRTFQARAKVGVGTVAAAGTGFLGVHKYQQHQDRKIMEKIDELYRQR